MRLPDSKMANPCGILSKGVPSLATAANKEVGLRTGSTVAAVLLVNFEGV